MRIGIHTWGSEGDLRPFAALAHGLAKRGHDVQLAYTSVDRRDYSAVAARGGFRAYAVGARYFEEARGALAAQAREFGDIQNPLEQLRLIVRLAMEPVLDEMYRTSSELCAATDVEIIHFVHHPAATAALAAGRPPALVFTAPAVPSRHYPPLGAPNLGPLGNVLFWRLAKHFVNSIFKARGNELRVRAGLAPVADPFAQAMQLFPLTLTAVSPALFPRPADWDARHALCGFFGLPDGAEAWEAPAPVAALLAREPRPVFFSFGSITAVNPEQGRESVRLMADAARLAGVPAIVQAPAALWEGLEAREDLQLLDHAPHSRIFPRCAAVVHHGGAGTTQAATSAGCPSVVVPHGVDQFFWGKLLQRRGLAPALLDRRQATASKLAARIRAVMDRPVMKSRAEEVGAAMRAEDGIGRAIQLIEEKLGPR